MGKCESDGTSRKLRKGESMNIIRTEGNEGNQGFVTGLHYLCYLLFERSKKSERAQIFARLIEAATAERHHESSPVLQPFGVDLPFAPREKILGKGKRVGVFIFQHNRGLMCIPLMFRGQHRRA